MKLPPLLMEAIADLTSGRVVLIIGAGCSVEAPTSVPMARECSREAYESLVNDGILDPGIPVDIDDLSAVTDAVVAATGLQSDLVQRLPIPLFELATPNDGYLLAAAMLRERAIGSVLTLNFDMAMSHALSRVGASNDVRIIHGPGGSSPLANTNLIYLHRNVNADHEDWILTTSALNNEWKGQWEESITNKLLASSVVVFAGLGSPAKVLTECTTKVRNALRDSVNILQVDPMPWGPSIFTVSIGIVESNYLETGWVSFMALLSNRLRREHRVQIEKACVELQETHGWQAVDTEELCDRLERLDLLELGSLRASWMLSEKPYMPHHEVEPLLIADLLLAIRLVEVTTGFTAVFSVDGVVEFRSEDGQTQGSVLIGSGSGHERPATLEARIRRKKIDRHHSKPTYALVSGVTSSGVISPPIKITGVETSESIVRVASTIEMIHVDEIRETPDEALRLLS